MKKLISVLLLLAALQAHAEKYEQGLVVETTPEILNYQERAKVQNQILNHRLNNLLPQLMKESGLDMWLVINREYGEDRLFYTLVPQPTFAARRTTLLVFALKDNKVERFSVSRYSIGDVYKTRWDGGTKDQQWQRLAEIIEEYEPNKIGINVSKDWAIADGLSQGLYQQLNDALPEKYQKRLVSSKDMVIRWMETRTEPELALYPNIVKMARSVISEAFSTKAITPGVTTSDDLSWFIRERFEELQLSPWFQPYVTIQRKGDINDPLAPFFGKGKRTIMPGDLIHTDVGICYLGLCTDTQEVGYVAKNDEFGIPQGFINALAKGNQWQDQLTESYATGKTGNEILKTTQEKAKRKGLISSTYTHPLGFVGHAVGPTIGMWDNQAKTPIQGDWKLYPNTAYAIEGNVKVKLPEWDNQLIQIPLEQSAYFDGEKVIYLGGRQTEWHFVK
ncbi:M24 family metallopeptidase [Kangiella sp. HZ709]|uniref:M24 family metallopeptidase n=1 Tax=Kangiella sp. HZ709 TaxID=2666328 RepID=UPI0012B02484|nr:M24 family metallopeptidase [Kangiella sp. HZ709]MRX28254.1 M24 family metallopeptidase [Kangiella sp. HZ709]